MDEIQKELIKAGRKDLAQEYYKKVAAIPNPGWKSEADFKKAVKAFETAVESKLVRIKIDDVKYHESKDVVHFHVGFQAIMTLKDPYVDSKSYEKGEAYIYLSNTFYSDVEKYAKKFLFARKVSWNNTKTIGFVSEYFQPQAQTI